jgi:hypothetical protein
MSALPTLKEPLVYRGSPDQISNGATDDRVPRELRHLTSTSHLTLTSKIVNRNGPIILVRLSRALRFLGEIDGVLNDLLPMTSIIPDNLFAAIARPQMATRTRIAAQRVERPARLPLSRRLAHGRAKVLDFSRDQSRRRSRHAASQLPAAGGRLSLPYPDFAEVLAVRCANNWYIHQLSRASMEPATVRGSSKRRFGNRIPAES